MKEQFRLGAAVLAAGASSRMGTPKLLLRWNHTTALHHLLTQWQEIAGNTVEEKPASAPTLAASRVAVVCAPNQEAVAAELERIGFPRERCIMNPEAERGMFSSIQAAARWPGWDPQTSHIAVVLGDQPHLRAETLRRLAEFASGNPRRICQPCRSGRARHPVIFPRGIFMELARAAAGETLKEFLERRAADRAAIEIDDPGLDLDLDTPADYEAALKLQSARHERQ